MAKQRLDVTMVERGLAESRERAQALILAGQVRVGSQPAPKPGTSIAADALIEVIGNSCPWVSRGGLKLVGALDTFGINPQGGVALDVGASTGGFTDVLLSRGVLKVYAIDVGKAQLHWKLRQDTRVISMEGVNARFLGELALPEPVDITVIDVSFISLDKILPALPSHLKPGCEVVSLVKPQFEAGPRDVGKGGIVRDEGVRQRVMDSVMSVATKVGYEVLGRCESPIRGTEGNVEFFLHLRWGGPR